MRSANIYAFFVTLSVFALGNCVSTPGCELNFNGQTCKNATICMGPKYNNSPEDLGCFEQGPHTEWCHQFHLPQAPAPNNAPAPGLFTLQFWLFTPEGLTQEIDFWNLTGSVRALDIDLHRPLFILIHGFQSDWPKTWMFDMRDALLPLDNNVIICRWTGGSGGLDYWQAASNVRTTAAVVARIIQVMRQQEKINPYQTTLVGFSLGAHVAGFAGAKTPGLRRIIGLDPAGPLFAYCGAQTRLNYTDALLVQAIHCNGQPFNLNTLDLGFFGTMEPVGHVDFYANGGLHQPECDENLLELACSHTQCPYIMTASVLQVQQKAPCKFRAFQCEDTLPWLRGNCFKCDAENSCANQLDSCHIPGYSTDLGTTASGSYMFSTIGPKESSCEESNMCGHNFKISFTRKGSYNSGMCQFNIFDWIDGSFYVFLSDGSNAVQYKAHPLYIKSFCPGQTNSTLVTTPWVLSVPKEVRIQFDRNSLNPVSQNSFTLSSVTVTLDEDCGKRFCQKSKEISMKTGDTAIIELEPCA